MKRWLSLVLVLTLMMGLPMNGVAEEAHDIVERVLPVYIGTIDDSLELPFYFMDGVEDLPWVELESWSAFMTDLFRAADLNEAYQLSYALDGDTVTLTRENDSLMCFDFEADTIRFSDYNAFLQDSSMESTTLDMLSRTGFDAEGQAELFQRNTKESYERAGDEIVLKLADYNIHMILQDDRGYVPFQTLGDFLIAPHMLMCTLFNGKAAYIADSDQTGYVKSGLTPLGTDYYSVQPTTRSEALAEYGYNELCLALDNLYGLSEIHDIDGFDQMFWQIGYDTMLKDPDPETADLALYDFLDLHLNDLHSGFLNYSWMTGARSLDYSIGASSLNYDANLERFLIERSKVFGEKPPFYEEVGNTAYISFDNFRASDGRNYYDGLETGSLPDDTIGYICYAHRRIYRDDSPIENVVFDLSANGGGSVDAALFVAAWVLGNASLSVKNTFTGAISTALYRADVNLDREFNSGDELDDKNVYCLISPLSFSCGNLIPAMFKESQKVVLLGRASGGGSCLLQPMSTAWGTMFRMSGANRMSFMKNGSFYDIDTGIEPDIYISRISNYYNREALTEFLNSLF